MTIESGAAFFGGKLHSRIGGSRDIGRSIPIKLAEAGAKVCINYFGRAGRSG